MDEPIKSGAKDAKGRHADLIPHGRIDDILRSTNAAYMPDTRPMLLITPSVATVLQAGISELDARLQNAERQWDSTAQRLERSDKVLHVYLEFLENVKNGKQDADYIREAVTHLFGVMY